MSLAQNGKQAISAHLQLMLWLTMHQIMQLSRPHAGLPQTFLRNEFSNFLIQN